ncbi:MAG TPA: outer membrane beta-barrel protein [Xanthobacteraceae bacterium]|nr:outer membrane beta-barrel protein [Xanthobacteraceae bacterium]
MSQKLLAMIGVSAALLAAPLAASAADLMPLKAPMPAPVMSWTGCYVDGGWGYGMWNQDHYFTDAAGSSVTTTDGGRGWMGKVGGGCDYQTPWFNHRVVVGVFGDWDPMSLKGTISPSELFPPAGAGIQPLAMNEKETSAWFVGARVGYLVTPSVMTYFDGGYTRTRFTTSSEYQTFTGTPIAFSYPNYNDSGWFLGSGFEYSLNDWVPFHGLFLQTEYRFSEYGRRTLSEFSTATGLPDGNTLTTRPYVQTVTTALVWKFNWTGR